jgi:hypothetical protein
MWIDASLMLVTASLANVMPLSRYGREGSFTTLLAVGSSGGLGRSKKERPLGIMSSTNSESLNSAFCSST